jgi:hypothetical protein
VNKCVRINTYCKVVIKLLNTFYIFGILDKTNKSVLNERDVVSHVFEKYPFLYSEDIESIQEFDNYFTVSVYPNTLIHFGQFNIYKG